METCHILEAPRLQQDVFASRSPTFNHEAPCFGGLAAEAKMVQASNSRILTTRHLPPDLWVHAMKYEPAETGPAQMPPHLESTPLVVVEMYTHGEPLKASHQVCRLPQQARRHTAHVPRRPLIHISLSPRPCYASTILLNPGSNGGSLQYYTVILQQTINRVRPSVTHSVFHIIVMLTCTCELSQHSQEVCSLRTAACKRRSTWRRVDAGLTPYITEHAFDEVTTTWARVRHEGWYHAHLPEDVFDPRPSHRQQLCSVTIECLVNVTQPFFC